MSNPWDIPPYSDHGDKDANETYAAVGRALSYWEMMELDLARLYAMFLDIVPIVAINRPEYKDAHLFRQRAAEIQRAAAAFFITHPDQELEGTFSRLIETIQGYSNRRNNIAHGIVSLTWLKEDRTQHGFSGALDRGEYVLTPATYRAKHFDSDLMAEFAWNSEAINRIAASVDALRPEINELWGRVLLRRKPSLHKQEAQRAD